MKNEVIIPVTIVQIKRDIPWDMNGRTGKSANILVSIGGEVVRVKADNTKTDFLDKAEKSVNQEVPMIFTITAGNNLAMTLKATGISTKK